ncbi:MAG TPA: MMPL family transporter [Polyangiaceae bacterium]|jgi:hypothetical protein|nr:MMPL family transporter [Polyangiaceae bacterium]
MSWVARVTLACQRRAVLVLIAGFAVLFGCGWHASHLRLEGDFVELLPTKSEAGQRFRGAASRMRSSGSTLIVLIDSPNADQNRSFMRALEDEVRKFPSELVASVDHGPGHAVDFFENNKWLFAQVADLERVECELEEERAKALPGYVELDNPCSDLGSPELIKAMAQPPSDAPANAEPAKDGAAKDAGKGAKKDNALLAFDRTAQAEMAKRNRFPDGDFRTPDGKLFALVLRAGSTGLGDRRTTELFTRIQEAAAQTKQRLGLTDAEVGYAGDIPNALAERKSLEDDLTVVSVAAVALILSSIMIFFFGRGWALNAPGEGRLRRTWRATKTALFSLSCLGYCVFVGCSVAFAVAMSAFGRLNAATTFLGSIIVGNGINYSIVYLARYHERRAQGESVSDALCDAATRCLRGTWLASAAASGGYGALMATDFRGFSEFGLIGAVGMLGCWLATFVLCPAAVSVFERTSSIHDGDHVHAEPSIAGPLTRVISWIAHRYPLWCLAIGAVLSVVLAWRIPHYFQDPWEYDFGKLGSASSRSKGAGQWSSRSNELFGARGSAQLLLADDMSQVLDVAAQVARADAEHDGPPLIEKIETIYDIIGGPPDLVQKKLALLAKIRTHIDAIAPNLSPEDRPIADKWRPPESLAAPKPDALPPEISFRYTEKDGRVGTPVYVTLASGVSQSRGETLLKLNELLNKIHLPDQRIVPNAARATVFAEMIRSMGRDGPRASWLSFGLVVLVTAVGTRSLRALVCVLGSLLMGLGWMLGFAAWGDLKLNFLNFVAIPLTFGIGVEYAINLFDRIVGEGEHVERGIRSVGGPVMLCSLTTILGYGALLFADNRALVSFGHYAILGELTCIVSALFVLPGLMWLYRGRKSAPHA